MAEHTFGGPWTEIKLDAVHYYLECYTKALKRVGLDLSYIDAFAGTGTRDAQRVVGGLFEGKPVETVNESLAGSARRALSVRPSFDHFLFIEKEPSRCSVLEDLKTENQHIDIEIVPGEANGVLRSLVRKEPWCRKDSSRSRGVVFLDPYALQVEWETLKALASTRVFDVWYLFPIRDTIRQLAHNFEGIGPKQPMLDRLLGPEWRELYSIAPEATLRQDLFDETVEPGMMRIVSVGQFEQWLKRRLQGAFQSPSERTSATQESDNAAVGSPDRDRREAIAFGARH